MVVDGLHLRDQSTSSEERPKLKHEPGVYEVPAHPGWCRLIAVDRNGNLAAVSEFLEGTFDVLSETRRLMAGLEKEALPLARAVGSRVPLSLVPMVFALVGVA